MTQSNAEIIQELVDAERLKVAAMTDQERAAYYDEITARQRAHMTPYTPGPRQAQAKMPEPIPYRLPDERLAAYTDDQLLDELKRRKMVRTLDFNAEEMVYDIDEPRGIAHMEFMHKKVFTEIGNAVGHEAFHSGVLPRGSAVFKEPQGYRATKVKIRGVVHVLY